jgi:hypothetical protein
MFDDLAVGVHENIDEDAYFDLPDLSQSGMKALLDCPARFDYQRRNRTVSTDAQELGSTVHSILLGSGAPMTIIDAPDWRTKAAREARDEVRASGGIAMLEKDYQRAEAVASAALENPEIARLLGGEGQSELTMRWVKDVDGSPVPIRGRIDRLNASPGGNTIVDVKAMRSANPDQFARAVFNYGYALQQAVYSDGWELLTGDRADFVFVVIETEAPYLSAVYRLDEVAVDYGRQQMERALRLYVECTAVDAWPGYPGGVLESPAWVRRTMDATYEAEDWGVSD